MDGVSANNERAAPTGHQVGDIITYPRKGQTYRGEILAIRGPTVLQGKPVGWHYVVMRDGANTCLPDIVPAEVTVGH
jgi:hypothetical protein